MNDRFERYVGRFDAELVEYVSGLITSGNSKVIDPHQIPSALGNRVSTEDVIGFLFKLVADHIVHVGKVQRCGNCNNVLENEAISQELCFECGVEFNESEEPYQDDIFYVDVKLSRDISWLIIVHGFNTRGPWQEALSWQIATKLKYSAPVMIYKYGFERLGILYRFRHRKLAHELGQKIRKSIEHARENGIDEPPDVIVHSFGSLLFSKILSDDAFRDLKFGRIICVGAVIDPNYDWSSLAKANRIDAVLCHCGAKDKAVPWAQHGIPDSGPAATKGFSDPIAKNVMYKDFGHSTALEEESISMQLADQGIWHHFLTAPEGRFQHQKEVRNVPWSRWHYIFRSLIRSLVLVVGPLIWVVGGWRLASIGGFMLSKVSGR